MGQLSRLGDCRDNGAAPAVHRATAYWSQLRCECLPGDTGVGGEPVRVADTDDRLATRAQPCAGDGEAGVGVRRGLVVVAPISAGGQGCLPWEPWSGVGEDVPGDPCDVHAANPRTTTSVNAFNAGLM